MVDIGVIIVVAIMARERSFVVLYIELLTQLKDLAKAIGIHAGIGEYGFVAIECSVHKDRLKCTEYGEGKSTS